MKKNTIAILVFAIILINYSCNDTKNKNSETSTSEIKKPENTLSFIKTKGTKLVDEKGNVLGSHNGIVHYTVGQRKGIGIVARRPLYVSRIDGVRITSPGCNTRCVVSMPALMFRVLPLSRAKVAAH